MISPQFRGLVRVAGLWAMVALAACADGGAEAQAEPEVDVPAPGLGEPLPTDAGAVIFWQETFDGYDDVNALKAAYGNTEQAGTIALDATGGVGGSKAYRVDWEARPPPDCVGKTMNNTVALLSTHSAPLTAREFFMQTWLRFSPGFTFVNWNCDGNARKHWLHYRIGVSGGDGRLGILVTAENARPPIWEPAGTYFGTRWHVETEDLPGESGYVGLRQHLNDGVTDGVDKRPQGIADGEWHRQTLRVRLESAPGVGDGLVQMWIDGLLVMDYDGADPDSPAFGLIKTKIPGLEWMEWPTVFNRGAPQPQTEWWDGMVIWHQ
jgi:hypothetical protein